MVRARLVGEDGEAVEGSKGEEVPRERGRDGDGERRRRREGGDRFPLGARLIESVETAVFTAERCSYSGV